MAKQHHDKYRSTYLRTASRHLFGITRGTGLHEMRLAAAVKWYEMEEVSQSKAAEIAAISRAEFLTALARFKVLPFQITGDDLIQEVADV
jgi:hypothetical protein